MPGPAMFPDYIFTRMGPDDREQRSSCRRWLSDNLFLVCTLLGVTGGIILVENSWGKHVSTHLSKDKAEVKLHHDISPQSGKDVAEHPSTSDQLQTVALSAGNAIFSPIVKALQQLSNLAKSILTTIVNVVRSIISRIIIVVRWILSWITAPLRGIFTFLKTGKFPPP
ncbi:hypothetical protein GE061_016629 [Apolygus lucorum]|uniref:Uncharacterized protein n=1 Tax=Apolygus lucorum TaxID=248454 RepID=A0A8S9XIU1_APOLU|nr:hypothetical protein GE061_016629 [Apolygus lucorum]